MTDAGTRWNEIRDILNRGRRSTGHFAIASVDADGVPNITPVGTVFFRNDRTAFYFDQYTSALTSNLETNSHVCLMAVDRGTWFWFRSLLSGRFPAAPGVRLYGTAGPRRPATDSELTQVRRRVRPMWIFRGGRMLWSDFSHVRDITFTSARPVRYPVMMSHLNQADSVPLSDPETADQQAVDATPDRNDYAAATLRKVWSVIR
ncbi:pyridoxamine 5'-phosphate oxidase family protein [Nocardia sp. NPDC057668]|uniref:pyridoxamine 5'-phosphate oxidase family protein n=1 Tax=Nocardia sp. NPDC057668 TaxID=3346202 RepID=UPI003671A11D